MDSTILVIDDDPSIGKLLKLKLEAREYDVITAEGGHEALEILKNRDVDMILLDQMMPDMDGLETFEQIKKTGVLTPAIMMTAHGSLHLAVTFMQAGGKDFVLKPVDIEVLNIKIRQNLGYINEKRENEQTLRDICRSSLQFYKSLDEMIEAILPRVSQLTGMEFVAQGRIVNGRYEVERCFDKDGILGYTLSLPLANTYCHKVYETGAPVFIMDAGASGEWRENPMFAKMGFISYIGFPVYVRDKIYGTFQALSKKRCDLDDFHIEIMQLFAQKIEHELEKKAMLDEIEAVQNDLIEAKSLSSMNVMTASIAHEMRQPLTAADLDLSQILEKTPEGDIRHCISAVRSRVKEALLIIRSMLKVYRGNKSVAPAEINLNSELESALYLFGRKIKGVEIVKNFDKEAIIVVSGNLSRIFVNIIGNALEALSGQGVLTLTTHWVGETLAVSIEDNGSGIEADSFQKIFDPEYTDKKPGEGTGLGLWIARKEVERIGGRILVDSEIDRFTRFTVEIPRESGNAPVM